jgi:hypothetical protein
VIFNYSISKPFYRARLWLATSDISLQLPVPPSAQCTVLYGLAITPLSEDATVLFENKQPFRAGVFYINRRAKVPKTKPDRCSYV